MDPQRTCVACRQRRPQRELVRIVATDEGFEVEPDRRPAGRGAYVCPEQRCVSRAAERGGRVLRRALRSGDDSDASRALDAVPVGAGRDGLPEER